MNGKFLGVALIALGGWSICCGRIRETRQRTRLMYELAAALERMEGMIRWQNLPMTRVLESESNREPCGKYFMKVRNFMKGGFALQEAWQKSFFDMEPEISSGLLCRMDLQGDTRQVTGALHLTAEDLRCRAAERASHQTERERLCITVSGCLTAVLVIVLI